MKPNSLYSICAGQTAVVPGWWHYHLNCLRCLSIYLRCTLLLLSKVIDFVIRDHVNSSVTLQISGFPCGPVRSAAFDLLSRLHKTKFFTSPKGPYSRPPNHAHRQDQDEWPEEGLPPASGSAEDGLAQQRLPTDSKLPPVLMPKIISQPPPQPAYNEVPGIRLPPFPVPGVTSTTEQPKKASPTRTSEHSSPT